MRTRIDPVAVGNNSDPEPWLTPRFVNAGCFATEATYSSVNGRAGGPTKEALTATVEVLSTMANALQTDDKVYTVGYADGELAATTFAGRIGVGISPLVDPTLTIGQRAALLTGAMVHEVGHINNLRLWVDHVSAAFGIPKEATSTGAEGFQPSARQLMALKVLNVASDIHDEEAQRLKYSGYADTLDVLVWYAAGGHKTTDGSMPITGPALEGTFDQRFNEALAASRFPWVRNWTVNSEAVEWLEWWDQWAEASADCRTADAMLDVVQRGVEKIMGSADPVTPKGDDDDTTCGPVGPGGDKPKPGGEGKGKGKGKGDDTEGEDGDDGDNDGDGGTEGDDEDGDGDDTDEGGDAEGDDADEPKGSEDGPKGQPGGDKSGPKGDTTDPVEPTDDDGDPGHGRGPGGTSNMKDIADLDLPECPVDALHRESEDKNADMVVAITQKGRKEGVRKRSYTVTQGGHTVIHHVTDESPKG